MGDAGGSGEDAGAVSKIDLGPLEMAVSDAKKGVKIANDELEASREGVVNTEKATAKISAVVRFFKEKVETFFDEPVEPIEPDEPDEPVEPAEPVEDF